MNPRQPGAGSSGQRSPEWMELRRQAEAGRVEDGSRRSGPTPVPYRLLKWLLRISGQFGRGYRNFLDLQTIHLEHVPEGWPAALDGLRILQISDLHIDLDPGLLPVLIEAIGSAPFDMAVITGDFWEGHSPPGESEIQSLRAVREALGRPSHGVFGVLGNHDSLQMIPIIESLGIRLLINEAVVIGEDPAQFALAGVDDPFIFKTDDVCAAASQCPEGMPRVLLSHSPQVAPLADRKGFCFMLSGHTHGGQICLPGRRALVSMEEIPPPLFTGSWKVGKLKGYTTRGAGACHIPVRYNCPPEVVFHKLRKPV